MLIAQISDLHIKPKGRLAYQLVDTAPFLRRCVDRLNALVPRPDVVLATGDLADAGTPDEYARLRDLLAPLHAPLYLIPGNHDDREALRAAFPDHRYLPRDKKFLQYVVDGYPLRLIGLDTLDSGKETGLLCAERLAWLAEALSADRSKPTVIFMHHPPFETGIAFMDSLGLTGREAMAKIVADHPQVERILCGHQHRPVTVRWAGTVASIAPSVAHQVALQLWDGGGGAFVMEPSACQLLLWKPGSGLIGHQLYLAGTSGPYPFRNAGRLIS